MPEASRSDGMMVCGQEARGSGGLCWGREWPEPSLSALEGLGRMPDTRAGEGPGTGRGYDAVIVDCPGLPGGHGDASRGLARRRQPGPGA